MTTALQAAIRVWAETHPGETRELLQILLGVKNHCQDIAWACEEWRTNWGVQQAKMVHVTRIQESALRLIYRVQVEEA